MKRFGSRGLRAVSLAVAALAWSAVVAAQEPKVVPSRPGQRSPVALPAATEGGIRLSLDQAIGLAVSNNADLNVTVNAAEANRYLVLQDQGIFDPLIQAAISRSRTEQPATSTLVGANVQTRDSTDGSIQVSQLAPTGGVFTLGLTGNRTKTNSTFFNVNPSYSTGVTLQMNQPLLRNAGYATTTWLIRIAKNTRDSSYQDYLRSVQATVNTVEQAYWDLVYALQNLDVKRESLRIAQELNRITRIKIDVGSLAPIEITQTEVGIANAEQDIITAKGLIGDAQDRLKRVLNVDPAQWNVPIVPTDQVRSENVKIDLDRGVQSAMAYENQAANFSALRIYRNVGNPAFSDTAYRALVVIKWVKADGSVEGTAKATIDVYQGRQPWGNSEYSSPMCAEVATAG
jgi:outer membrane protein TolC